LSAKLEIQEKSQHATQVLTERTSSAQDKFRALEDLAKSGGKTLDFTDLDGTQRQLRLEYQRFQSNGLIHIYAEEAGREQIVLRAVCNPDGSYSLERNEKGMPISFYGSYWTSHEVGKSYFAPSGEQETVLPADSPEINALFDQAAKSANAKPNKIQKLANGAVYYLAKMDIDADGSPRAKEIDPKDGSVNTSLRYPDKSSVNAETMPYFVMPGGKYQPLNIALGDIAAVRYKGKVGFPVFADVGPAKKLGEGSMALASELDIPNSPINGGIQTPDVEYIVFPRSGDGTPGTKDGNSIKALQDLRDYVAKQKKGK
jgi:hypothetical protein